MKIEELDLSARTYNCLKRAGIDTVEQLQVTPIDELEMIRGMGAKSIEEIAEKLLELPQTEAGSHEVRLIDANALLELYADTPDTVLDPFSVPIPVIRQNILDMPTINAVMVPNCDECYWNGNVRGCWQCEHCIGNTSGTNNFLHKNEVTCDGK